MTTRNHLTVLIAACALVASAAVFAQEYHHCQRGDGLPLGQDLISSDFSSEFECIIA